MPRLTLNIVFDPQPQRPACAWLLPAPNPAQWLDELLAGEAPLAEARLVPLTPSEAEEPLGALALFPEEAAVDLPSRWLAYGRIGANAYLPVHARLEPAVTDAELSELLQATDADDGSLWVWTPHGGLLRTTADNAWHVSDMLRMPPPTSTRWDAARPGESEPRRVTRVAPRELPSEEELREEWLCDGLEPSAGADETGEASEADEADAGGESLDALSGAPPSMWGRRQRLVAASLVGGAALVVLWCVATLGPARAGRDGLPPATSQSAPSPSSPLSSPPDQPARWLSDDVLLWIYRLLGVAAALGLIYAAYRLARPRTPHSPRVARARGRREDRAARRPRRNVSWLIDALARDSDGALEYAVPLGGGSAAQRGAVVVRDSLTRNLLDLFAVASPAGGAVRATADQYRQLRDLYYGLANRELGLQRYRRAAYIWGFLLNQWGYAAKALEQGHLHRDAARVYLERLSDRRSALQCLMRGRCWEEALALLPLSTPLAQWTDTVQLELLATIYAEQQRCEEQRTVWRRLVQVHLAAHRHATAASLIADRLSYFAGAIAVLRDGTECERCQESERAACLGQWLELLQRRPQRSQLASLIERLAQDATWRIRPLRRFQLLNRLAQKAPDAAVRDDARSALWSLAEALLAAQDLSAHDQREVANALNNLAAGDVLLRRDLRRGLKHPPAVVTAPPREDATVQRTHARELWLAHEFRFVDEVRWCAVATHGDAAYLGGFVGQEAVLARLPIGPVRSPEWKRCWRWQVSPTAAEEARLVLVAHDQGASVGVVGGGWGDQFPAYLDASWASPVPFLLSRDCCAIHRSAAGDWWSIDRRASGELLATGYDAAGRLRVSLLIGDETLLEMAGALEHASVSVLGAYDHLIVGCGAAWFDMPRGRPGIWRRAPGGMRGLFAVRGAPSDREEVLFHCDKGVYTVWPGGMQPLLENCEDLQAVALADGGCLAWDAVARRWEWCSRDNDGRWGRRSYAWDEVLENQEPFEPGSELLLAGNPCRRQYVVVPTTAPSRAYCVTASTLL